MNFEVIKSETLYQGKLVDFRVDTLRAESGEKCRREILVHRGAVVMIPCLDQERALLVKQYRHAAERSLWEFPAGTLEPNESTEDCARRELREEVGYEAKIMRPILSFFPSPGVCTEKMFLFLAEGLTLVDERPAEAATITVEPKRIDQLLGMVYRGEVVDAKTIVGIYHLILKKQEDVFSI